MTFESVALIHAARRYLTSVLLNLPIDTTKTTVATLLVMLDHFAKHPDEYRELTNVSTNSRQSS